MKMMMMMMIWQQTVVHIWQTGYVSEHIWQTGYVSERSEDDQTGRVARRRQKAPRWNSVSCRESSTAGHSYQSQQSRTDRYEL